MKKVYFNVLEIGDKVTLSKEANLDIYHIIHDRLYEVQDVRIHGSDFDDYDIKINDKWVSAIVFDYINI